VTRPRDTLFVYRPGFLDGGERWFCPYSAQVIGFLAYYPEVRETVDVVEVEFPRPRWPIVALLGEDHQAAPILVLHDGADPDAAEVPIGQANGRRFVDKTIDILRYLASTRGVPRPH
jgi:hypothetical protein